MPCSSTIFNSVCKNKKVIYFSTFRLDSMLLSWILPQRRVRKDHEKKGKLLERESSNILQVRQRGIRRRTVVGLWERERRQRGRRIKRKSGWSLRYINTNARAHTVFLSSSSVWFEGPTVSFSKEYTVCGLCHTRHALLISIF